MVKHTLIQKAIKSLTEGEGISSTVAASIMESIMTGELPDAQIAAYLATLHAHGEDPDVVAENWG